MVIASFRVIEKMIWQKIEEEEEEEEEEKYDRKSCSIK